MREGLGVVTQPRRGFLVCLRPNFGSTSSCTGENLQKNRKLLLAENAAKHTQMLKKIYVFTQKFSA
jgi:hypothetical protein